MLAGAAANEPDLPIHRSSPAFDSTVSLLDSLTPFEHVNVSVSTNGRERHSFMAPAIAVRRIRSMPRPQQDVAGEELAATVQGVLYAVNLHTRHLTIADDLGTSIDLDLPEALVQGAIPLLSARVVATGRLERLASGRHRLTDVATISASWDEATPALSRVDQERPLDLPFVGIQPLRSVIDLALDDLTREEAEAFIRSADE